MVSSNTGDYIKKAVEKTINNLFYWVGSDLEVDFPEYVLTTNIADALSEKFNVVFGYKIYLERKTRHLIKQSLKYKFHSAFYQKKSVKPKRFISGKEAIRNGRVDVAVVKDTGLVGELVTLVEVKGINPARSKVIADLRRLKAFVDLSNEVGCSTVDSAYFVAIYKCDKLENYRCADLKYTYESILSGMGLKDNYNLYIEPIRNTVEVDTLNNEFIGSVCLLSVVVEIKRACD